MLMRLKYTKDRPRSLTRTLCRVEGIKSDCCGEGAQYSAISSLGMQTINLIYDKTKEKWPVQEPEVQTFRDKAIEVTWKGKDKQIILTFEEEEVYFCVRDEKDPSKEYYCLDLNENMQTFIKNLEGLNE